MERVSQVKAWYQLENYGKYMQVRVLSADSQRAHNLLESSTYHDGERYWVGRLWTDDSSSLLKNYYSALAQFKTIEKRLEKDSGLKSKYTEIKMRTSIKVISIRLKHTIRSYVLPVIYSNPTMLSSTKKIP